MLTGVLLMIALAAVLGFGLAVAARRLEDNSDEAVEQINALLPQTQCAQCGYPGCRPYAAAIAAGETDI